MPTRLARWKFAVTLRRLALGRATPRTARQPGSPFLTLRQIALVGRETFLALRVSLGLQYTNRQSYIEGKFG